MSGQIALVKHRLIVAEILYSGGMKRYLTSHLPLALVYALVVFVVKGAWWPLSVGTLVWGWWVMGVVVGVLILFLDRVVYTYSYPAEQLSQMASYYYKEKSYGKMFEVLYSRKEEQNKLTFRSALFIAIWVPLAFFALTSTTSLFGKGVVMGLMLHILYDGWRLQKMNAVRLNERLFWQIARPVRQEEQLVFMWVITALFGFFSFWVG